MEGKNLIDEFNQKYAKSEKNGGEKSDSGSDPGDSPLNENVAIIHVIDEAKRRQQDFK